jgi:hypothetical protein
LREFEEIRKRLCEIEVKEVKEVKGKAVEATVNSKEENS